MDARGVKGITIAIVVAVLVMPFIYHKHLKCNMSAIVNQVVSCSSSFKDSELKKQFTARNISRPLNIGLIF